MNIDKVNKLLENLKYQAQDLYQLAQCASVEDDDDIEDFEKIFKDIVEVRDEISKTVIKIKKEV